MMSNHGLIIENVDLSHIQTRLQNVSEPIVICGYQPFSRKYLRRKAKAD